jgi:cytochrome c-type biogenesis protein CcmF
MNLGQITIIISFLSSLAAAYFFFKEERNQFSGKHTNPLFDKNYSARLFGLMTLSVAAASVVLYYLLLTHQFEYSYVARYSSLSQPTLYIISAFWAGQEGTFLLWALLVALMGVLWYKSTHGKDKYAMAIVSLFSAFLYFIMILKSPFELLPSPPRDGQGMNPLLMNPWMAIHPPILFVGYAATIFPFALVVSALARRTYDGWIQSGFAWTLFSSVTLGAGIIIGGFWAYETLGWGGYWGWDPVENSSLVPWLILLALIHGFLIQRTKGSLTRTNLLLGILSFLLVFYATFLTRSGILADFSVHSFVDLGINNYLIGMMVFSSAIGLGLFAVRFRNIPSPKIDFRHFSREVALLLSMVVLCLSAAFIFVGMSSPIITGIIGKASQVDISYYNTVNEPIAIAIGLLLGITPFVGWSGEQKNGLLKRLSLPLLLTALSCVIAYVAGVNSISQMVFVGSAAFALISNSIIAFRQYRSGWLSLGGPIAHIGTALLLIGILGSGSFDEEKQIVLRQDEPQQVFGYQIIFKSITQEATEKPSVNLEVHDGNKVHTFSPKLYFSQYNNAMMREPDIKIFPLKDLYLSPIEVKSPDQHAQHPMLELAKGQAETIGEYNIEFVRFETGQHGQPGSMSVGAVLKVNSKGIEQEITPKILVAADGQQTYAPVELPVPHHPTKGIDNPHVTLAGMSVEQKKVLLSFHGLGEETATHKAELILEVSIKPLMMVVWTGVVLIIGGSAVAFRRRLTLNGTIAS